MFIRFSVENFLSFNERQEFSMIAGKVRQNSERLYNDKDIKLLKFASLFGANASGKSNLVSALEFARRMILSKPTIKAKEKYCKISSENITKASYFDFEIKIGKKYYAYGFEINLDKGEFISEWLYNAKDNKVIFERNMQKGIYALPYFEKNKKTHKRLQIYIDDIKTDSSILFLQSMNRNKKSFYEEFSDTIFLKNIFRWFLNKLHINFPDMPINGSDYFLLKNEEEIFKFIKSYSTGITQLKLIDVPLDELKSKLPAEIINNIYTQIEKIKSNDKFIQDSLAIRVENYGIYILEFTKSELTCKTLNFIHNDNNAFYALHEESDGTIRLLDLLDVLLSEKEEKVYIIDEIDRCLHPQLTYKFISDFLHLAKKRNIQLIVTSHESRLLDFELLRKDEIWFVDKNKLGESKIYSLDEFNERFDKKVDKAYLEGRYGGVPIFNTVFPINEV